MEFKNLPFKSLWPVLLIGLLLATLLVWKMFFNVVPSSLDIPVPPVQGAAVAPASQPAAADGDTALSDGIPDDASIQQQLDLDRQQQRQTRELKVRLEQLNLELEQEKALTQINALKKDDAGAFDDPIPGGQNNLPQVIVNYIGGDGDRREAILSIGGTSFNVKEKSRPTDSIEVVSISDSTVTLHFSAPQEMTKTFDFKPE